VQLEFKRLALLTSNTELYKKMSDTIALLQKKQMEIHVANSIPKGLYPVTSNIVTGDFNPSAKITFGGLGDSFYECKDKFPILI
jgi:NAD(P)H-hydrate repair Nnr-like enzyme with NAD(P)H-hydrate epimerase domain